MPSGLCSNFDCSRAVGEPFSVVPGQELLCPECGAKAIELGGVKRRSRTKLWIGMASAAVAAVVLWSWSGSTEADGLEVASRPAAPAGFYAQALGGGRVRLAWEQLSVGVDRLVLRRRTEGAFREIGRLDPGSTVFEDQTSPGYTEYELAAMVGETPSLPAFAHVDVSGGMAPPGMLSAEWLSGTLELSWEDSEGEDGYEIEVSRDEGPARFLHAVGRNEVRYVVSEPLLSGATYAFRVSAVGSGGRQTSRIEVQAPSGPAAEDTPRAINEWPARMHPKPEQPEDADTAAAPAEATQPQATENLLPHKRPHREIMATTASYGGPARLFGDKLMMRVMNNLQRIPAGKFYACEFDPYLESAALEPGQRFSISVADRGSNFGPMQEAGPLANDMWFEAQVLAVRKPDPANPKDEGGVVFRLQYLVWPHPNGDPDLEMAVPVKAVVVGEPRDDRPDFRTQSHDNERLWSAFGQMAASVEGYFYGGAASVLLSKLNDVFIGEDRSNHCFFMGAVQRYVECYVRIDEDAIF